MPTGGSVVLGGCGRCTGGDTADEKKNHFRLSIAVSGTRLVQPASKDGSIMLPVLSDALDHLSSAGCVDNLRADFTRLI